VILHIRNNVGLSAANFRGTLQHLAMPLAVKSSVPVSRLAYEEPSRIAHRKKKMTAGRGLSLRGGEAGV
jgi:hypothetical protein